MHISTLVKALRDLKLQIEESIAIAETRHTGDIDDKVIQHVEQCQKSLSAIWFTVHGPPVIKLEKTDSVEYKGTTDLTHPIKDEKGTAEMQVQNTFDNLDDIEFADFFDEHQENKIETSSQATSKDVSQEKSSRAISKDDTASDVEIIDDEFIQAETGEVPEAREVEANDFNDSDFDDELLNEIEHAEKSAMENSLCVIEDESDDIHQPSDPSYQEVLKQYFGYSKFRPLQWKIINSVLNEKRDNCVIMATGYGKSLTFQFPSVFTKRTSVIISPLISLMEDQVHGLKASNIEACFLGSAQSESAKVKRDMFSGHYRLVYVTPEFATNAISDFKELDSKVGIDLIAIDEAHCVSQWGHDFRASYRKLGVLKKEFPKIPILAVTATATFEVQKDICSSLRLTNPSLTCTGFDRPNLYLNVIPKTGDIATDLKSAMQKVGYKYSFDGPTIIYCPTKKITEKVTEVLYGLQVPCLPYHASLSVANRRLAHQSFLNDDIQVVIATVAFGMGIDKPDVRRVIHYGAPKDIESYYQEIGRAGRDGLSSICTTIFSKSDFNVSRHFISTINSDKFREHKMKMLSKMEQYLESSSCRRRMLLSYFESGNLQEIGGTENCCDNCRSRLQQLRHGVAISSLSEKPVDYKKEAQDLFTAIEVTGNRFGLQVPIQVLLGSTRQKVQMFKSQKVFGSGKYKSTRFWTALGRALIYDGYLREKAVQGGFGSTVEITQKAKLWLDQMKSKSDACHMFIKPSGELLQEEEAVSKKLLVFARPSQAVSSIPNTMPSYASTSSNAAAVPPVSVSPVSQPVVPQIDERTARLQNELYMKLLRTRNSLSHETGFTPHNIASNKLLLDMAKFRPSTRSSLLKLEDFSEVKADRFGDRFLELIKSYCSQNSLKMDDFPSVENSNVNDDSFAAAKDELMRITETQRQSYIMFAIHKQSLEEIASRRGLKVSTIITHLCQAMKEGLSVDVRQLGVTEKIENLITKAILSPPVNGGIASLTKIKDQLPDYVEYNHVKIVIALLVQKYGQEVNSTGELVLCQGASLNSIPSVSEARDNEKLDCGIAKQNSSTPKQCLKRPRMASPAASEVNAEACLLESSPIEKSVDFTQSQSLSQSQSESSQNFSQSNSQAATRKLPLWATGSSNKAAVNKKMKSNSLFR